MPTAAAEPLREGALEHLITQRISEAFAHQAQDGGFRLGPRGMRVRDDETGEEYCPELVLLSPDSAIHTVVEITDRSGMNQVYGRRARCYRSILSVEHYIIVSTDKQQIAWFSRLDEGKWLFGTAESMQGEVHLESLNATLSLAEIYEGVLTADGLSA